MKPKAPTGSNSRPKPREIHRPRLRFRSVAMGLTPKSASGTYAFTSGFFRTTCTMSASRMKLPIPTIPYVLNGLALMLQ